MSAVDRLVVVGGGIAGVESALTLARAFPDSTVTLVGEWPSLRLRPNLVYVPFGVSPHRLDLRLDELLPLHGVTFVEGTCTRIDRTTQTVYLESDGTIDYDQVVVAPGTVPQALGAHRLRTLDDAYSLRDHLQDLRDPAHRRMQRLLIHVLPDCIWPAPAYEIAFLADTWLRSIGLRDQVELSLATEELNPCDALGPSVSDLLTERLSDTNVEILGGLPGGRLEDLDGDVVIELGGIRARRIAGLPPLDADGFYATDEFGRAAPNVWIVGDAEHSPIKSAFAAAWQARRIVEGLGGSLSQLGDEIDGIPVDQCEYQMDLGNETVVVRMSARGRLHDLAVDQRAVVSIRDDAPDKLKGLLLRQLLVGESHNTTAAYRFRDLLASMND